MTDLIRKVASLPATLVRDGCLLYRASIQLLKYVADEDQPAEDWGPA